MSDSSVTPMDWSPAGSSVHGISQARILEWVAISFSRGIFPTQELNLCLQHWQVDSLPLSHQGIQDKKVVGIKLGFPGGSVVKNLPVMQELKNTMGRAAWWATVHRSQRIRHD